MGSLPPNESSHVMAVVEPTPQKEREREWAPWAMGRLFFWGGGWGGEVGGGGSRGDRLRQVLPKHNAQLLLLKSLFPRDCH